MKDGAFPLELPASVREAATRLAHQDGVALNDWIVSAVAQKVGAVETAADFFRAKAGSAQPSDLKAFLAIAPDRPPLPGDELPE
jgi:hypothetical protein